MKNGDPLMTMNGKRGKRRGDGAQTVTPSAPKKPGRKPGKHSDENYTQTSIYLPIALRNRVRARLYERGMEMSGLVENMLREWLTQELALQEEEKKS